MAQISSSFYRRLKAYAPTRSGLRASGYGCIRKICSGLRSSSLKKLPRATPFSRFINLLVHRLVTLCILACLSAFPAQAAPPLSSSDIEAAYLYNFGKFIEWPAQPEASAPPFAICVVGTDGFGATLESLIHNDTIHGRAAVARRLASVADADACQILFFGSSEQPHLAKDLDDIKDKPILTVSSIPGFLDHGGMIQFLVRDNRVRFAVNLTPSTQAHLALSSELLKVAVFVHSKPAQEGQ